MQPYYSARAQHFIVFIVGVGTEDNGLEVPLAQSEKDPMISP